jgi:uncharacterized membrane protein
MDERSVNPLIEKNIRTLLDVRRREERQMSLGERLADAITRFSGSIPFLVIHAAVVILWFLVNTGMIRGIPIFDPYPFVMLAMAASVEAIFLSTFVLITQNRQAALAEKRAELDLQMGLLTEHEVTRLIQMLDELLKREGLDRPWPDLEDLKKEVAPERVMIEIERELGDS